MAASNWTKPPDLKAQLQKLWDRGLLLRAMAQEEALFPYRLRLQGPSSNELAECFDQARTWIASLLAAPDYRIELREVRHRSLGLNQVPDQVWVDSFEQALKLLGKQTQARQFASLLELTRARQACLLPWLIQYPLKALSLHEVWGQLLDVVGYLQAHPRPAIYIRQIDLPGIHSKFIEQHKGVLSEFFELALPATAIDPEQKGLAQFCGRYGFLDKPLRVRVRMLDLRLALLPADPAPDYTLTAASFARLNLPLKRVLITENEINFLSLPPLPASLAIFGSGFGFSALAQAQWLRHCPIYYWGDIDSHGFSILDQLRSTFPHAQSLLMDRATLMEHQAFWGSEGSTSQHALSRLSADEQALYDDLRTGRIRPKLRLEQEQIKFGWLKRALDGLQTE